MQVNRLLSNQTFAYFIKAALVVGCLMLAAWAAPHLPSALIPFFVLAYAVVATMGALYHTVLHRLHKQKKLTADGMLAKLNRKWTMWLIGYMVLFSFSGFFFLLGAPAWDGFEWLLMWFAIPVYYGVFFLMQRRLRKEYAPEYYKAQAMLWSFWIAGAILCAAYALLVMLTGAHAEYSTLREAFDAAPHPYEHAPSLLMMEADYLSSFTDGLTNFAFAQVERASFIIGFVCQFALYALALFGLMNQFGFCLLTSDEVKSEFRILPADDEDDEAQKRIRLRYVLVLAGTLIVVSGVFWVLEFEAAKIHASGEVTVFRSFVEEQRDRLIALVDELPERERQLDDAEEETDALKRQMREELAPLINGYYDACVSNIGSYLDWYYGPFGRVAKFFGNVDDAAKTFKERVTAGTDDVTISERYRWFQAQINDVYSRLYASYAEGLPESLQAGVASIQDRAQLNESIELWLSLGDEKNDDELKRVLLSNGEDEGRQFMEARLADFINAARAAALQRLE